MTIRPSPTGYDEVEVDNDEDDVRVVLRILAVTQKLVVGDGNRKPQSRCRAGFSRRMRLTGR